MKIIILLLLFSLLLSGCSEPIEEPYVEPPEFQDAKQQMFENSLELNGWKNPTLLSEINSIGWEDGAYISPDGLSIYFAYFQGDLIGFVMNGVKEFEKYKKGPQRGVNPAGTIDVFVSYKLKEKNFWSEPTKIKYSEDLWSEGGAMISEDKLYYMSNKKIGDNPINDDIYVDGRHIEGALNTIYDEEDPHAINNGLFFWSEQRPCEFSGKNIWYSELINEEWSEPVCLPSPINNNTDNYQPFLTADNTLYFTSARAEPQGIYKSKRVNGIWEEPIRIITPSSPNIAAVGEPTLTNDGRYLYFVVIFHKEWKEFDADIAFVEAA